MSGLEDRCLQFHEAALGTGKSKGPVKEIATLRKFLHKNQTQRFTDKATSRLFDTIQIYCTSSSSSSSSKTDSSEKKSNKNDTKNMTIIIPAEDKEGLLEDALKMPFTVFTTKQKKTMLKWIEDIRGSTTSSSSGNNNKNNNTIIRKLTVIDISTTTATSNGNNNTNHNGEKKLLSLMDEESGDTYDDIPLPNNDLGNQIEKSYEQTEDAVDVEVMMNINNNNDTMNDLTILKIRD